MASGTTEGRGGGSQAVARAAALLRCFEVGPSSRALSDLARSVGLSVSTTHRILSALVDSGLLQQDPASERYALGAGLAVLGARASTNLGLPAVRPVLVELARATGESVNLGMSEGDDVLVALAVPSTQQLRFEQTEGSRVPLHASAMGKVLLAFAPDSAGLARLGRLVRLTGTTITSKPALLRAVEQAREQGWAVNDEEREPGVRTVAVPVLGPGGGAVAAIAVQGPTTRMTHDRVAEIVPLLGNAAVEVTRRMAPNPTLGTEGEHGGTPPDRELHR